MDYFKILPVEITLDILTRLPAESVLDSKLVCTNWRSIVSEHPLFSKMHFHHLNHPFTDDNSGMFGFLARTNKKIYYFEVNENYDVLTNPIQRVRTINFIPPCSSMFVDSLNGLICLVEHQSFWICNPITREYVILPKIKRDCFHTDEYGCWMFGFGYVSSTNEYKVVAIYLSKTKTHVEVQIYTIGSRNGWRTLGKFNHGWSPYNSIGVFANGAIYWLDHKVEMTITFDLAEEKLSENLLLPLPRDRRHTIIGRVYNGLLSLVLFLSVERYRFYDIWLLKKKNDCPVMKEGEEHQSLVWSKKCRIDETRLFAITKSDHVFTYNSCYLNIYDTETSTSKELVNFKYPIQVSPHQNTLVSLKELGEEDIKLIESGEIEEIEGCEPLQKDAYPDYIYF